MREMTIREVLLDECNWPRNFLSPSGEIARFDIGKWRGEKTCGFRPFSRWQRFLSFDSFLPVDRVMPIGCQIRFNKRLADNLEFIGLVEPTADNSFLYGEWLNTFSAIEHELRFGSGFYFSIYLGEISWICSYVALTFLHDVSIKGSDFD